MNKIIDIIIDMADILCYLDLVSEKWFMAFDSKKIAEKVLNEYWNKSK